MLNLRLPKIHCVSMVSFQDSYTNVLSKFGVFAFRLPNIYRQYMYIILDLGFLRSWAAVKTRLLPDV